MKFDLSLYLVTDPDLLKGRDIARVVEEAVRGGVTMVQLREKNCSTRDFLDKAVILKKCLSPYGIPLIINDRLDIALAADADGLHIGQSDMPWEIARNILGPDKILGLSLEHPDQARQAAGFAVDYVAASPVFSTPTKTDTAKPLGIEGIRKIKQQCSLPLVGIGGIHKHNIQDVIEAGADGAAVVSAILGHKNTQAAARILKDLITNAHVLQFKKW